MSDHDNKCEFMLAPPDMNRLGLCLCKERALKARLVALEATLTDLASPDFMVKYRKLERDAARLAEAIAVLTAARPLVKSGLRNNFVAERIDDILRADDSAGGVRK